MNFGSAAQGGGGGLYNPGGSGGLTGIGLPTGANTSVSSVGKTNVDLTNPGGSVTGILGSLGGLGAGVFGGVAGAVGSLGVPGGPNIGGVVGAGAQAGLSVAGGIGDIGIGGFGVKQGIGAAGDVISAPQKFIQSTAATMRIQHDRASLPADLQLQLDQGVPMEHVANELADRNMGYSSDPLLNLGTSLVLDPMNLVGAGLGKVATLGSKAAMSLRTAQEAADVGMGTRFAAALYNSLTVGLPRAGSALVERAFGPISSGAIQALGHADVLGPLSRLAKFDPAAVGRAQESLGVALGNIGHSAFAESATSEFRKGIATMATDASRAEAEQATLTAMQRIANGKLQGMVANIIRTKSPIAPVDAAQRAEEAAGMLSRASGTSLDVARQVYGTAATAGEWLAARLEMEGAFIKDTVALKAATVGTDAAAKAALDVQRLTALAPETIAKIHEVPQDIADLEAAIARGSTKGRTVAKLAAASKTTAPDQLAEVMGPARAAAEAGVAARDTGKAADIMRGVLARNPEITDAFKAADKVPTAKKVLAYLQAQAEFLPKELKWPTTGEHPLPAAFEAFRAKWGPEGYGLGFEPKGATTAAGERATYRLVDVGDGTMVPVRPWVPLVDESLALQTRNPLGRVYDSLFGGINQARVITEARVRLATYGAKYGITAQETKGIMSRVLTAANELKSTPRATYGKFDAIFTEVLGRARFAELEKQGLNPTLLVNGAFEGNLKTIGLTQKVTGAIKTAGAQYGNWPVKIAEQLYPGLKFAYNPLFFAQQLVENPFFNIMRGINPWRDAVSDEFRTVYVDLIKNNEVVRNVMEAGIASQVGGAMESVKAFGDGSRLAKIIDAVFPKLRTEGLSGFSKNQMLLQVAHDFPTEFRDAVTKMQPDAWKAWVEKMGTQDPAKIAQAFVTEHLNLAKDQAGLKFELDAIDKAGKLPSATEQTMWNAYKYALNKVSDRAYQTHFFNPTRGALERTLNHPYLGLYPLSYMWGKVVPEFARFLFLKPFGKNVPLVGYEAMHNVQGTILTQMNDPEFAKWTQDHKAAIYLLQLLLPATPTDIPVNAPAWSRHLAASNQGGPKFNPGNEASTTIQHIGVMNLPQTLSQGIGGPLAEMLGGLSEQLDHAAQGLDSMTNGGQ